MAHRYSFDDHPEHRAHLKGWAERWIANAMSTAPADRERATVAIDGLYEAAGLVPPPRKVFVSSPMSAVIAGGVAAGVWWVREHPSDAARLFGAVPSEAELAAAARVAVSAVVESGLCRLRFGVERATRQATGEATGEATWQATEEATRRATWQATWQATEEATRRATWRATRQATEEATRQATEEATRRATWRATRQATEGATRQATWQATWQATEEATRRATWRATGEATWQATEGATWQATEGATRRATEGATWRATEGATEGATRQALTAFLARCTAGGWRMHNGGSDWSGWPAYLSFFRHIAQLPIDYSQWQHYETAAETAASRIMHPHFWIASDRHTEIHIDANDQLHNEHGPARRWSDGWAIWAWHGTHVPEWVITDPTLERIQVEANTEIRRCAIEHYGWDRYLTDLGVNPVSSEPDPGNPGHTLDLYDLPTTAQVYDEPVRLLVMRNASRDRDGSRRTFAETVPAVIGSAVEAAAWQFDVPADVYRQLERAT